MGTRPRETGPPMHALGLVLRVLRSTRKLGRAEVARDTDIPKNTLIKAESGEHSIDYPRLIRIAAVFGVPLSDIVAAADIPEGRELDDELIAELSRRARELAEREKRDGQATKK